MCQCLKLVGPFLRISVSFLFNGPLKLAQIAFSRGILEAFLRIPVSFLFNGPLKLAPIAFLRGISKAINQSREV